MTMKDKVAFADTLRGEIAGAKVFTAGWTTEEFNTLVRTIIRHATTLERLAVKHCNEPLTRRDVVTGERTRRALGDIATTYGVTFTIDGDPRGYVVKLQTPHTFRYNTMGGAETGWGVPTRYS